MRPRTTLLAEPTTPPPAISVCLSNSNTDHRASCSVTGTWEGTNNHLLPVGLFSCATFCAFRHIILGINKTYNNRITQYVKKQAQGRSAHNQHSPPERTARKYRARVGNRPASRFSGTCILPPQNTSTYMPKERPSWGLLSIKPSRVSSIGNFVYTLGVPGYLPDPGGTWVPA